MGQVQEGEVKESESDQEEQLASILKHLQSSGGVSKTPPIMVKVRVDDCELCMEVDTGAAHTLMSEKTFESLWPGRSLFPSTIRLQSYTREPIPVKGCCYVNIAYEGQTAGEMPLLIVEGSGPTLLRRDWLSLIQLNWREIHHVHTASLQSLLARYPSVFREGLGTLQGFQVKLHVDPNATPQFYPARSVAYAVRDMVD